MSKKIGIYGGTFDPIHHGHLILAREARERLGCEKIVFVPAATSPFKELPVASGEIRLSMLRVAIRNEIGFAVDDCELRRLPPSYAIDTVADIRNRENEAEIYYLIGEDNVPGLRQWHRFAALEKMVRFVVFERSGAQASHSYHTLDCKIDISATEIRKRVASGRSIRYLVPPAVEEIIKREGLYQEQVK